MENYDYSKSYSVGQKVRYNSDKYKAVLHVPVGMSPLDSYYWEKEEGDSSNSFSSLSSPSNDSPSSSSDLFSTVLGAGLDLLSSGSDSGFSGGGGDFGGGGASGDV